MKHEDIRVELHEFNLWHFIITDDNLYNVDNLDDDINKLSLSSDFYQLTFNNSSESSNNNNLLSDQSQQKNNKFIIKNITNIKILIIFIFLN